MIRITTSVLAATMALSLPALTQPARAEDMVFLSTQLRPVEEAQKMREIILKAGPVPTTYVADFPQVVPTRLAAEREGGKRTVSLIGALHGELQPLVTAGDLVPLDGLAAKLAGRGIPPALMELGKLGTAHQMYIPWMQATYIMVANRQALPFLPKGADINALTFEQLAEWSTAVQAATGKRMLGFPAGPQGLMHRFFEGFLYPSYTGGVVSTFRSPEAEAMWTQFAALWKTVNPNSTSYNFMQEPLLAGDVWIGFDHVARMLDALRQKPDQFVAFPAPAGPKGRGYMPIIAGLAIAQGAPDVKGADALIDYLSTPATQIKMAQTSGFFPVVTATLPDDLEPGLKLAVAAIARTQSAPDAKPSLLPIGLGTQGGAFDKIYLDTFQRVVLRGEKPRAVLDRQAEGLKKIIAETGAPCWLPDKPSQGPCPVE
jgi:multiple sugar transport system substrate-binding protein